MQPRDFEAIPGWLTREQADLLREEAGRVPPGGVVVEVGSHHGRSTVVLGAAVAPDVRVVAIDPFLTRWRYGAPGTEQALRANLAAAGLTEVVDVRVDTSRRTLAAWRDRVDLVYVDGKHDYWSTRHDLGWSALLPDGGCVLVHDAYSSVGVTLALLRTLLTSTRLTYVDRAGSLVRLRVGSPEVGDRLRALTGVPWWLRNLLVKTLLRLRLTRVAAGLGHHGADDPY